MPAIKTADRRSRVACLCLAEGTPLADEPLWKRSSDALHPSAGRRRLQNATPASPDLRGRPPSFHRDDVAKGQARTLQGPGQAVHELGFGRLTPCRPRSEPQFLELGEEAMSDRFEDAPSEHTGGPAAIRARNARQGRPRGSGAGAGGGRLSLPLIRRFPVRAVPILEKPCRSAGPLLELSNARMAARTKGWRRRPSAFPARSARFSAQGKTRQGRGL